MPGASHHALVSAINIFDFDFLLIILLCSMIAYWHHLSVCPSVCDVVHWGAQGRCRGLNAVPQCSYDGTSYSVFQPLLS